MKISLYHIKQMKYLCKNNNNMQQFLIFDLFLS